VSSLSADDNPAVAFRVATTDPASTHAEAATCPQLRAAQSLAGDFDADKKKTVGCVGIIGSIVAIGIVALVIWFAYDSSKPKLFAKVEVTSKAVRITNGNDTAWDSPTIILNDGFAGPILVLAGPWAPNETRELSLGDFQGRLNHQPFKPGYEKVREVTIQARGFQLGIYRTR
jgi:hypothetical protein